MGEAAREEPHRSADGGRREPDAEGIAQERVPPPRRAFRLAKLLAHRLAQLDGRESGRGAAHGSLEAFLHRHLAAAVGAAREMVLDLRRLVAFEFPVDVGGKEGRQIAALERHGMRFSARGA